MVYQLYFFIILPLFEIKPVGRTFRYVRVLTFDFACMPRKHLPPFAYKLEHPNSVLIASKANTHFPVLE